MTASDVIGMRIKPGVIISGPFAPEPIEVLAVVPLGVSLKVIGRGTKTGLTHDPVLNSAQIDRLSIAATSEPFDGDAALFRLGVEAHRLGLAYEYDPYFSLSIARVDPLPHQLEAVYDDFLTPPASAFCWPTIQARGKRSWPGCS